jgi:hypothetical protein
MGFSQIFALVASYEYAYFAAPVSAQSLFMSLNFCSAGISSIISTVYINVFPNPKVDLNFKVSIKTNDFLSLFYVLSIFQCGKDRQWYWSFYDYFFILAGFQLIFVVIFILCQKWFQIVKLNPVYVIDDDLIIVPTD